MLFELLLRSLLVPTSWLCVLNVRVERGSEWPNLNLTFAMTV
jgi:hypothetical protein